MALISKSFPRSTRPSLQTLRHSPAPADKSRKARAKTPLTRPSLQTAPRPTDARVAAVAPQGDCSRSTGDACADTRANNRDGVEPTRAAPAPGSRGSRHRSAAWPVASVAVGRSGAFAVLTQRLPSNFVEKLQTNKMLILLAHPTRFERVALPSEGNGNTILT